MMGPFEGSAGDRTREFTMSSVLATAAELSADTEAADDHAPARRQRASCRRLRGPAWREALSRGLAKVGDRECLTPAASSVYLCLMRRGPRIGGLCLCRRGESLQACADRIARTLTERSRAACPGDTQAGVLRALLESRDAPETWPADGLPDSLPDGLQSLPWWMLVISALAVLSVGLVLFWDAPSA